MSTPAIDHCLKEMEGVYEQLMAALHALQTARTNVPREDTRMWLQVAVGDHQSHIAMLDGLMGGLKTLAATEYPKLVIPEMPEDVREDVQALYASMTKSSEDMKATMDLLKGHAHGHGPKKEPEDHSETPPVEGATPETPRRGRGVAGD